MKGQSFTLERRNPLPGGFYWVDVESDQHEDFGEWLRRHRGAVMIRETEGQGPTWVKFEVIQPVPWNGPGLPTVAHKDTHRKDTIPNTRGESGAQRFGGQVKKLLWFGAFATGGYFGLDLVLKHKRETERMRRETPDKRQPEEVLE